MEAPKGRRGPSPQHTTLDIPHAANDSPPMDTSDLLLAAAGLAAGGFLKGATGAGAPVVGVPVLALIFGVQKAVAIFAVLNLVSNIWQLWAYRIHLSPLRFSLPFAGAGAVGAVSGSVLLATLPTQALMAGLAGVVYLYIALRLMRPDWQLSRAAAHRLAAPTGLIAGVMQGAGGISAPVSVTFLNAIRPERSEFVATISLFFFAMAALQIPTLVAFDVLTIERVGLACLAAIPMFGAMPLGERASRKVSKQTFDKIILGLLAVIAPKLTYDALI